MSTIYHVCRGEWDGGDLRPLVERMPWGDDASDYIAANWPDCDPWAYYCTEGHCVHCHATLEQASEFADEYGGQIVAIDGAELAISVGSEYPHPVFRGRINKDYVRAI